MSNKRLPRTPYILQKRHMHLRRQSDRCRQRVRYLHRRRCIPNPARSQTATSRPDFIPQHQAETWLSPTQTNRLVALHVPSRCNEGIRIHESPLPKWIPCTWAHWSESSLRYHGAHWCVPFVSSPRYRRSRLIVLDTHGPHCPSSQLGTHSRWFQRV